MPLEAMWAPIRIVSEKRRGPWVETWSTEVVSGLSVKETLCWLVQFWPRRRIVWLLADGSCLHRCSCQQWALQLVAASAAVIHVSEQR